MAGQAGDRRYRPASAAKRVSYLLRAAPEVLRENPSALFVFAGDGPDREALEREAKNIGVLDAMRFLGVRGNIPDLLASIDVLAMPSISEGMPMALLEAMACGKAVVAARVGAIGKVIEDRVNGLLMEPGDVNALAAGINELSLIKRLSHEAGSSCFAYDRITLFRQDNGPELCGDLS